MAQDHTTTLAELQQFIETEVRPSLLAHGGDITISTYEDGVLRFRLKGHCSGCPSAWLTAEEVIKAPIMERFPDLKDVVVDNDLDEEMIRLARDVLSGKWRST